MALAHNKNDLAETMLHHLARGTGLRGLCSLKPVNGEVIRPLLCLERKEIDEYIKECGIPGILDSTNLEDESTRRPDPQAHPSDDGAGDQYQSHRAYGRNFQNSDRGRGVSDRRGTGTGTEVQRDGWQLLPEGGFFLQKEILKSYGVRVILETLSGQRRDLSQVHIRQTLELYLCQVSKRIDLPYGLEAVRSYDGVCIRKKSCRKSSEMASPKEEFALPLSQGMVETSYGRFKIKIFPCSGEKILEKKYTKWFDCDKIKCSLSVRTRKSGDYLVIGKGGESKKLTRCMIDDRVPKESRSKFP